MIYGILELIVILAELGLNRYAYGRGGLYKHLYFRRMQFESGFLNQNNLIILSIITLTILILSCLVLYRLRQQKARHKKQIKIHLLFMAAKAMLALMIFLIPNLRAYLLIYPYLLVTLGLLAAGNVISIFILLRRTSNHIIS